MTIERMIVLAARKSTRKVLSEDCIHEFRTTATKLMICQKCKMHYSTYKSYIDMGNSLYRQGVEFGKRRAIQLIETNDELKKSIPPSVMAEVLATLEQC